MSALPSTGWQHCIVAFRVRRGFDFLVLKFRPGFALCIGSELLPEVIPCYCPGQNPEWVLATVTARYSRSGAIFLLTTKVLNSPPGTLSHSPLACWTYLGVLRGIVAKG